jgi:hypothetical protein
VKNASNTVFFIRKLRIYLMNFNIVNEKRPGPDLSLHIEIGKRQFEYKRILLFRHLYNCFAAISIDAATVGK